MVHLAVVPSGAVGLAQPQHRDPAAGGEGLDLAPEAVADLPDHRRGGDRLAQVIAEALNLATDLKVRDVGVQVEPINAVDLKGHVTVEHVVDIHQTRHARPPSTTARRLRLNAPIRMPTGPALPARIPLVPHALREGAWGEGLPSPH